MKPPLVITRPGAAGETLTAQLRARGFNALWSPAFEIVAAPDPALVRATLARLEAFDLAVFVSPEAARAAAAQLVRPWPPQTAIAAVGAATLAAVAERVPGAASARLIGPQPGGGANAEDSGSEALWRALSAAGLRPRRTLLQRAQSGRDWLLRRLVESGSEVTALAVYARRPMRPDARVQQALRESANAPRFVPVFLVSSSEAVDVLFAQLGRDADTARQLRTAHWLATHPRIADRLRRLGVAQATVVAPSTEAIVAALGDQ